MSVTTMEMTRTASGIETFRADVGVAGWAAAGEDRVLVRPDIGLYGVFDGVGLSGGGGVAAQAAAVAVEGAVEAGLPSCRSLDEVRQLLVTALNAGDMAVHAVNSRHRFGEPGATTAVLALVVDVVEPQPDGPVAVVAHIGDSRLQLVREAHLRTVTLDHGVFAEVETDVARERQDRLDDATCIDDLTDSMDRTAFTRRNMLTAALMGDGDLDVRSYAVPLQTGDRLALDSDGVHDNLTKHELCMALRTAGEAQDVADAVAARARDRAEEGSWPGSERSKQDDISVIVVEFDRAF